jgi:hypothetical protein
VIKFKVPTHFHKILLGTFFGLIQTIIPQYYKILVILQLAKKCIINHYKRKYGTPKSLTKIQTLITYFYAAVFTVVEKLLSS